MHIEQLSEICQTFNSVTTDIKWDNLLCFNIGGKMFFVLSPENIPTTASFKVDEADFDELLTQPGFSPAPYLSRYKWIHIDDICRLTVKRWKELIEKSYSLIASKLPNKVKIELNIE